MAGARKKVLWVDDEIEFLRSHIMFLETRGYHVTPVFGGDDAIEMIKSKPREFDIVLLDEQMPGKNGLATLEEIKALLPDLPVVMVTKSEEERVMEDAFGKKIDGYLTKPVNPSQILSVCKAVLDSKRLISTQMRQRFMRDYSENRGALSRATSAADWVRLYNDLAHWDIELDTVEDEALRQSHAGQKSDSDAVFCQFVGDNYGEWVRGERKAPTLSVDVMRKYVVPRIKDGRRVFLLVLDCLRLDQFLAMEPLLKEHFEIDRHSFFSVLPTTPLFSRSALLDGRYPSEIAEAYPGIFDQWNIDDQSLTGHEKQMILNSCRSASLSESDLRVVSISDNQSAQSFLATLPSLSSTKLVTILINSARMLLESRSNSAMIAEIAPDESAFRAFTRSWFQHSALLQVLHELAKEDATVILAADHGSVLCGRGTELYGTGETTRHLRCQFGSRITCDERHAFHFEAPQVFRIPHFNGDQACILARENFFFVYGERFKSFQEQYQNSFHYGGISMDEMIVPLAVMHPREKD